MFSFLVADIEKIYFVLDFNNNIAQVESFVKGFIENSESNFEKFNMWFDFIEDFVVTW